MSGVVGFTQQTGARSGRLGTIPSFKVWNVDGTHSWDINGRGIYFLTVAWDRAGGGTANGGITRSRSSSDVQGSNTITTYTAPVSGIYFMSFNINAGNNSSGTETRYASSYLRKNADGASCGFDTLQAMENITDGWGSGNSYWQTGNAAGIVELMRGEYVYLWIGRSSSSDYNGTVYGSATYWYGHLLEAT